MSLPMFPYFYPSNFRLAILYRAYLLISLNEKSEKFVFLHKSLYVLYALFGFLLLSHFTHTHNLTRPFDEKTLTQ